MMQRDVKEFRDGDWMLQTFFMGRARRRGFRRWHTCKDGTTSGVMYTHPGGGWSFTCQNCGEPIPDAMEGFIKLLEWDR